MKVLKIKMKIHLLNIFILTINYIFHIII